MQTYHKSCHVSIGDKLLFKLKNDEIGTVLEFGITQDGIKYIQTDVGNHTKKFVIKGV